MNWLALFSMTGSEIANISDTINIKPSCVITDNFNEDYHDSRIKVNKYWKVKGTTYEQKLSSYRQLLKGYDIITLHGWLNIIPAEICEEFKIYNGHPGLINYYPQLKGRDPQVRAYDRLSEYLYVGSVIHEVTRDIDCGNIICYDKVSTVHCGETVKETYDVLRKTSLNSWVDFFTNKRYNTVC